MKRRVTIGAVLVAVVALAAGMYAFTAPRAGAAPTSSTTTPPPFSMTMSVTGQKQGAFSKGTVLPLVAFTHEIVSPRDASSGLPTGRRQHKPMTVTMQWGATTPKFLTALISNESLSVLIGLLRDGKQVATIRLTNANVSHFVQTDQNVEFDFTYQKITWTWIDGGITAQDDWAASGA